MQIRIRSGKLEFLRYDSEASKAAKRSVQRLIKEEDFTEEERQQYAEYLAKETAESAARNDAWTAKTLLEKLQSAERGVTAGHSVDGEAAEIYAAIAKLQRTLRKAGIRRPQRAKKAEAAAAKS